ncbi:hypothetical protein CERSUDRAFT_82858 [Gelatoporia subvermispora B]|uniref:Cytochrome b mRNA-processing protein 4 n=1 Tax=Ceriporiopsis subvermispora (strain B) TaxID=914234 RepID=M2R226_CERS8|nr:hypothetical protein CERSUDRAFT_82858 [Gelatoporia subvermispora B]
MSGFPWGRVFFASCGIVGFGYVLMRTTTPTEEEFYNSLSPDLKRKADQIRAARLTAENAKRQMEQQVNNPDPQQPIWAERQPPKSS